MSAIPSPGSTSGRDEIALSHGLLRQLVADPRPALRVAVVAAHPEDETLGAAALLARLGEPLVLCLTDGAPRDPRFVPPDVPTDPAKYAELRRAELRQAMAVAGVGADRVLQLGVADQAASDDLAGLAHRLTLLLRGLRPQLVITHAYEGGHPDHDAASFVARQAIDRLQREQGRAPGLAEMLSYHQQGEALAAHRFLPAPTDRYAVSLKLSPRERTLRRRMLACFASQGTALQRLGDRGFELYRPAPRYDFQQPPHPGPLCYERLGLAITGERWRHLAARAGGRVAA